MRLLTGLAAIVILLLVAGHVYETAASSRGRHPKVLQSTAPQLVGFTAASYTGDLGGYFGATRKCQIEFSNTRMCTSLEVIGTYAIPEGLDGHAWVRPVLGPTIGHTGGGGAVPAILAEASGLGLSYQAAEGGTVGGFIGVTDMWSCFGWSGTSSPPPEVGEGGGLRVDSNARFDQVPCDTPQQIACCAPLAKASRKHSR